MRQLKVEAAGGGFLLNLDAVACSAGTLPVLSVAGAATHIKALAAILQTEVRAVFRVLGGNFNSHRDLSKAEKGYRVWKTRLGYNCWHTVAISKEEGLLPSVSDEAIWRELRSERFTTPLIRPWLPYILAELRERDYLRPLECWGCQVGLLTAESKDLDEIVSQGLQKNKITIV